MKCPKAKVKDRFSKTGKGSPGPHRTGIRGHTWKVDGDKRFCVHCGKTVLKMTKGKTIRNKRVN